MFNQQIVSTVIGLSLSGSPSTIGFGIWPVDINSIKGESVAARPHVGVETFKRFAPVWRHLNAASAVIRVISIVRVVASAFRFFPARPFSRFMHSVFCESGRVSIMIQFRPEAPTAIRTSASKVAPMDYSVISTGTTAVPINLSVNFMVNRDYGIAPEVLAGKVFEIAAVFSNLFFSHAAHPPMVSGFGQSRVGASYTARLV